MLTSKCFVCGKELTKKQKSFCSRQCFYLSQDKRLSVKCLVCNKEFKEKRSRIDNFSRGKYCSTDCYWKSLKGRPNQSDTKFGNGHVPWNKGKRGVMPEPWNKGREWKAMQGKNHPNWKNGRTDLRIAIRMLYKYRQWRTSIFERDNWSCTKCGAKRKPGDRVILYVHHLKAFYQILEDNNIKTVKQAKKCDELWDIDNGKTLCFPCHRQTDSYLVNQYTKKLK